MFYKEAAGEAFKKEEELRYIIMIIITSRRNIFPKENCSACCFDELNQGNTTKDADSFFFPKVI